MINMMARKAIIVTIAIMLMRNDLARISVDQQATGVSCPGELFTATAGVTLGLAHVTHQLARWRTT